MLWMTCTEMCGARESERRTCNAAQPADAAVTVERQINNITVYLSVYQSIPDWTYA